MGQKNRDRPFAEIRFSSQNVHKKYVFSPKPSLSQHQPQVWTLRQPAVAAGAPTVLVPTREPGREVQVAPGTFGKIKSPDFIRNSNGKVVSENFDSVKNRWMFFKMT